jgi:uncharacterized protein YqeY
MLLDARRGRDESAIAVLRETLAAIDNAEAPAVDAPVMVSGLGAGEIDRRVLGDDEVRAIVEREVRERRASASRYAALGRQREADVLEAQARVLEAISAR